MALVGYARVSSVGQSLHVQLSKLKHCDKIFMEKRSGVKGKRPALTDCLEYIREGDTLVVTRLDRLARSTLHLCQIADELQRKQVNLEVIDQNIDTSNATGRLLFNMLSAIAQFETEIRTERQMDGIVKAKERGVRFGRQKKLSCWFDRNFPNGCQTNKKIDPRANHTTEAQARTRNAHQNVDARLRSVKSKRVSLSQ